MLIIVEGVDKSGKSLIARRLHELYSNVVMVKKMYHEILYPIDWTKASEHDWVTLLDRVILANPDLIFVADRSFITQVIYQQYFAPQSFTDVHSDVEDRMLALIKTIPHLFMTCESDRYELDNMVISKYHVDEIKDMYRKYINALSEQGFNVMSVNTSENPFTITFTKIVQKIDELSPTKLIEKC